MEDKLRLNTKLYGFDGIIGRHDFFLNCIIIASIKLFFVLPYQIWLFVKIQSLSDLFNLQQIYTNAPVLLRLFLMTGIMGTFILSASNLCRRLNDINGKVNNILNGILSFLLFLSFICIILPLKFSFFISLASIIIALILLFKKGKITKNYPYDFTKEFNWGAYIGTWIWGLFNKSYKTLWILLLGFTPWGMYYQLYCGLKGNEWAFKNKKCDDVQKFNKSQEKQSTIFVILFSIAIPVIYFLIIAVIVTAIMLTVIDDVKNNPQEAEQKMEKLENVMNSFGSIYFVSHEITPDENKYYVSNSEWKHYSFKEKKDIMDFAASLASTERKKEYRNQHPESSQSFTKTEELPRTKIYSSETKHLLGEYHIDESAFQNGSFKEIVKASLSAYKFYNE